MQRFGSPYPSALARMPVAQFDMDLVVTRPTQGHEVAFVIGSAPVDWQNVVHFLNRRNSSFLQAAFTKWMALNISISNSLPLTSVLSVMVRRTFIRIVFLCRLCLMLFTISTIGEVRTAWILAWLHWLMWHIHPSFHEKSPLGSLQMDCYYLWLSHNYIIPQT